MSDIAARMIAERNRKFDVAMKALRMMQAHHGNPYFSFHCVSDAEAAVWHQKAEAIIAAREGAA
jgi:hypothetical protein